MIQKGTPKGRPLSYLTRPGLHGSSITNFKHDLGLTASPTA